MRILAILYKEDFDNYCPPLTGHKDRGGVIVELTPIKEIKPLLGREAGTLSIGGSFYKPDLTALLDFAYLNGTDKAFLEWVSRYGIGGNWVASWKLAGNPVYLSDKKTQIRSYLPLIFLRKHREALRMAVDLWQYIAQNDVHELRKLFNYDGLWLSLKGEQEFYSCRLRKNDDYKEEGEDSADTYEDFINHSEKTFEYAFKALEGIVEKSAPITVIKLEHILSKEGKPKFKRKGETVDPLSTLWEVLIHRLCKTPLTWPFRQCAGCGKWVNMSEGKKPNWKRCVTCNNKHRRDYKTTKQAEYRKQKIKAP